MPTNVQTSVYNPKITGDFGFYYPVKGSDWGLLAPGSLNGTNNSVGSSNEGTWTNANLAYNAGQGSLGAGTAFVKITYVSASGGASIASSEASVAVAAGSGAVTVTIPSPTPGAANGTEANNLIGWQIYSSATTGTEQLNTAGLAVAPLTLTLASGATVPYIPIATTTAQIQVYGTGAAAPAATSNFIQQSFPKIAANTSVDIFLFVSRTFRANREVQWTRPYSSSDPASLLISWMDCIAPTWPASTTITAYNAGSPANSSFCVLNGVLFACTTGGTTNSTVPTFNFTPGATTTDNTATWTCIGYRGLVRCRLSNTSATAGQLVAQEYDIFQP